MLLSPLWSSTTCSPSISIRMSSHAARSAPPECAPQPGCGTGLDGGPACGQRPSPSARRIVSHPPGPRTTQCNCPMGTHCGLKTVTSGTSATSLHFFRRSTGRPYNEIVLKISPMFPIVYQRLFVLCHFSCSCNIYCTCLLPVFRHPRDAPRTFVNIYCNFSIPILCFT